MQAAAMMGHSVHCRLLWSISWGERLLEKQQQAYGGKGQGSFRTKT